MSTLIKKIKFHLMRKVKSKSLKSKIINRITNRIGKLNLNKIGEYDIDSEELNKKGYFDLGVILNNNAITKIKESVKNFKCYDPFKRDLGFFNIRNVPKNVHVANYKREDLVTVKEIMNLANHPDILHSVQEFLGAKPTISNINMWWSFSGKKEAKDAQLFHRDVDDFKFIKLFFYLTDVDHENGPHVYVEGSSSSTKLRKIRRYSDSEIIDAFGENKIIYFDKPKGSSFLVDTYGFHKGLLPVKGERLLLQVQYSLNPIGIETYNPINIGTHDYDAYINRLIIK